MWSRSTFDILVGEKSKNGGGVSFSLYLGNSQSKKIKKLRVPIMLMFKKLRASSTTVAYGVDPLRVDFCQDQIFHKNGGEYIDDLKNKRP